MLQETRIPVENCRGECAEICSDGGRNHELLAPQTWRPIPASAFARDDLVDSLRKWTGHGGWSGGIWPGEAISRNDLQQAIEAYYKERGWSEWGPTRDRLISLGLSDLASPVPD